MVRPERYEKDPGISQSGMLSFEKSVSNYYYEHELGQRGPEKQVDAFEIGSLIDAIILDPEAKKNFHICGIKWDKLCDVVRMAFHLSLDEYRGKQSLAMPDSMYPTGETVDERHIMTALDYYVYYTNWKKETRVNKVRESSLWRELAIANGRPMVTQENWVYAHQVVNRLKTDNTVAAVFNALQGNHPSHIEVRCQQEHYAQINGAAVKTLVDFEIWDHKHKSVEPWDLKTTRSYQQFHKNYLNSKYGRQGSLYSSVLKYNYSDWKVLPFKFLVIPHESHKNPLTNAIEPIEWPEVFEMSEQELSLYRDGGFIGSLYEPGYLKLIEDIQWHKRSGLWQHRRGYYENNGRNILNSSGLQQEITQKEPVPLV